MSSQDSSIMIREVEAGGLVRVDRRAQERLGFTPEELARESLVHWIHKDDRQQLQAALALGHGTVRARHRSRSGAWLEFSWKVDRVDARVVAMARDANAPTLVSGPSNGASSDSQPDSMKGTLEAMLKFLEERHAGKKCSVLAFDARENTLSVVAGSSLPAEFIAAMEGLAIGPFVGSCGSAAYWKAQTIAEDIESDPLWREYRGIAVEAGLRSCWSQPMVAGTGEVLGVLAIYSEQPCAPTSAEMSELELAGRMVGSAIEHGRVEAALRKSEAEARAQSRLLSALSEIITAFVDSGDWLGASRSLVQLAVELTESQFGYLLRVQQGDPKVLSSEDVLISKRVESAKPRPRSARVEGKRVIDRHSDVLRKVITSRDVCTYTGRSEEFVSSHPALLPPLDSLICAPVRVEDEVVAMIAVANRTVSPYCEDTRDQLAILTHAASVLFECHNRREYEAALEEQVRQAGKMDVLGMLAGRIAHDFNNMLVAILGNAELAVDSLDPADPVQPMLNGILTAGNRAAELCNQMLAYSGRGALSKQWHECNEVIRELGRMPQVFMPKDVQVEYDLHEGPLMLEANRSQLRQVITNLVANAAEALGDGLGTIHVKTDRRRMEAKEFAGFRHDTRIEAGTFVRITVSDTGSGLSPETCDRVFEPFYTTKAAGRGLGLAAVQGIVLGHRGALRLDSQLGKGTEVTILLPLVEDYDEESLDVYTMIPKAAAQRILVVDDEEAVRHITARILEHSGFDVVCAIDGEDAVNVFRRESERIDCVLLDLSMPKLDGEATFKELRKIRGDVRVVLNSGYTEREMLDRFEGAGFAGVLQKPFPSKALVEKLRRVMS